MEKHEHKDHDHKDEPTGLAGHKHSRDPATRKAELLREGEFYRAGVTYAKAQVKHGARPEVMLHSALDHATWALRARADALLKPTGTSISVLMGVAGWFMKKRRAQREV